MLFNERDLEDYICNNQEQFIATLKKEIYGEDCDIEFIGRQVKIGEDNIADLVYYYENENGEKQIRERYYIIVELKFRKLKPLDLAQISRYMSCLSEKLETEEKYYKYENTVTGVFVSLCEDELMQEILINNSIQGDIYFLTINTNIDFRTVRWGRADEYIDNLKLDERIEKLYG